MEPCVRRDDIRLVGVPRVNDSYAGRTVETARRKLTARFKSALIESPDLDARLLVGHALGLDLTGMIVSRGRLLTADQAAGLEEFARRRVSGEPVARIIGHKEFWGLSLQLSAATLVPRPDTETVVELALEILHAWQGPNHPWRIADVGTGSGAILLALLSELPSAFAIGTDISPAALQTAHGNAVSLGFAASAFVACDYAAALSGPFDLMVSNPPYIRCSDIPGLVVEVRDHDPGCALDGGVDGLDAYRAIASEAMRLLTPGGVLVVEVGHDQSGDVDALMTGAGLRRERPPKADLAGVLRAMAFRKMPP